MLFGAAGCQEKGRWGQGAEGALDDWRPEGQVLDQIRERGVLRAITGYNPVSYFVYRGEPMGYEYELLQHLADDLGVRLELIVESDIEAMFERLEAGEGDLIAYRLAVTKERSEAVAFTNYIHLTRQVLVQQMPEGWDATKFEEAEDGDAQAFVARAAEDSVVTEPFELIGDTVHVPARSEYAERLANLAEEVGGEIDVVEVPAETRTSELVRRVAEGEIDYTVASEHIAELSEAYYGQLAARPALSVTQRVAWAARQDAPDLLQAVNTWLERFKDEATFRQIYNKYFEDRKGYKERMASQYLAGETGRLSEYDEEIKAALEEVPGLEGWDWRLIAAQMFQESRFDPEARSWAGAQGLMQLMPRTARAHDVRDTANPADNIRGALRFLKWLEESWQDEIPNQAERRKFVLASYNVGYGHVMDARRLAEKYGKNPDDWDDVAYYLLRKSKRAFYQDEVVQHGYARGIEPVTYVERILERFEHYRRFVV